MNQINLQMIKYILFIALLLPIVTFGQAYHGGTMYVTLGLGKCSACDYFHWLEEWALTEGVSLKYVLPSIDDEASLLLSEEYLYMSFKDSVDDKRKMVVFDSELFKLSGGGVKTSIWLLDKFEKEVFKGDVQHFPFTKKNIRLIIDTIYNDKKSLPSFLWNMPVLVSEDLFYVHNRKNDELFSFHKSQQKGSKQEPSDEKWNQLIIQLDIKPTDVKRRKFDVGDVRYHPKLNAVYVLGSYVIELNSKNEIFQPVIWVIDNNLKEELYLFNNKLLNADFYVRLTQMIPVGHSFAILDNGNLVLSIYNPAMLRFTGKPLLDQAPVMAEFAMNNESKSLVFVDFTNVYLPLFKINNKEGYFNFTSNPVANNNSLHMLFYQEKPMVFDLLNGKEIDFTSFFDEQNLGAFKLVYMNYDNQNNWYIYVTQNAEKLDNEIFIIVVDENNKPTLKLRQNLSFINPTFGTDEQDSSIIVTTVNSSKDLTVLRLKVE
jgi:hypothetical protein